LVAADANSFFTGYIYTSTDSGVTWTQQTGSGDRGWNAVASSADGTKLVAAELGGYIYTSTDSGVTWTEQTDSGMNGWVSVDSSADGTKLVAADGYFSSGYIYTSTDSGVTWTQQTGSGSRTWTSVASSADGTKLVAAAKGFNFGTGAYLYASFDGGTTWTEQTSIGSRVWAEVTLSADGSIVAAAAQGDSVYVGAREALTFKLNGMGISDGQTITSTPTFSGDAFPNSTITVTIHSDPIECTTVADSQGNWTCTPSTAIPAGTHTVNAVVTDPNTSEVVTFGPYAVIVPSTSAPSTTGGGASPSGSSRSVAFVDSNSEGDDEVAEDTATPSITDDDESIRNVDQELDQESKSGAFNWWPLIFSAVGGLVLLAIIVGVLRARQRE
jgi:hypothetical protein